MKTAKVKMAYAKAHFPELLSRVTRGERIVIMRYNTPIAELIPPSVADRPTCKFGTLKGRIKILDPHCFNAMTDAEADAWMEGRG